MESSPLEICRRIARLRTEVAGPRGKARFAKQLGLPPSTYDYYESSRVPPADVLVRIAEVAGVDLRWLLTGRAPQGRQVHAGHPAIRRAAELLDTRPEAANALAAFLDIVEGASGFPAKQAGAGEAGGSQSPPAGPAPDVPTMPLPADAPPAAQAPEAQPADESWIPVLGRSAAGVVHFWSDAAAGAAVTTLADRVGRYARARPRAVRRARAAGDEAGQDVVQIVTLSAPDEGDAVEFVAARSIKARHPDAFAVRIDGESMAPEIDHGDLVVLSPTVAATDGRPAVVQLAGQIGVTCKLFRREGDTVHLVAINEQYSPIAVPADSVAWALRVLARVRP